MKSHRPKSKSDAGAAILVALLLVFATTIAITAWMSLLTSRLRQSEANGDTVFRHVGWSNTSAINLTYAHYQAYRDTSTQSATEAAITTGSGSSTLRWGGVASPGWTALSPFRSTQRPASGSFAFPYNNLQPLNTPDHALFFQRTKLTSDPSQSEHLSIYNYLMTYPSPLLGDLLIIHKAAAGASGSYSINQNTSVGGRVVIWDKSATVSGLRANASLCRYTGGANAVAVLKSDGSGPLLPENCGINPSSTAGNGSTSASPGATDGTLIMCYNADFPAGSLHHIITSSFFGTYATWSTIGNNGAPTDAVYTTQLVPASAAYPAPTTSPYAYTPASQMNTLWVDLKNASLQHLVITGAYDQIVLKGASSQTEFNSQESLSPIIIDIEEDQLRDIRFIGENNRRLILGIKKSTGNTVYMGFSGASAILGGPLRWRLHLVNETGALWVDPPASTNITLAGSVRTNWQFNCTEPTNAQRINLVRETTPGALETMLPRDSYFTSYVLVR